MNKVTKPRNFVHMTENDWALYIQTFEPQNIEEANQYLDDLVAYSKTGNIPSGISAQKMRQLKRQYPELDSMKCVRIEGNDKAEQSQIEEGFFGNKL
jgi:hypothetical protein